MPLFEEVRSLLQQPASTNTWFDLCALCDHRDAAWLHEQVVPYIEAYLSRWPASIRRPVSPTWVHQQSIEHWLLPMANCIDRTMFGLDNDQVAYWQGQGLEIIQTNPLSLQDRQELLNTLLAAPDVDDPMAGDAFEADFEEVDFAHEILTDHYPVLGALFQPTAYRTVTSTTIHDALNDAEHIYALACRCGWTVRQAYVLAYGRVRVLDLSAGQLHSLPSSLSRFFNVRVVDVSSNQLTELPSACDAWSDLCAINVANNPIDLNGFVHVLNASVELIIVGNTRLHARHVRSLRDQFFNASISMETDWG